jgi:hypothetical protein
MKPVIEYISFNAFGSKTAKTLKLCLQTCEKNLNSGYEIILSFQLGDSFLSLIPEGQSLLCGMWRVKPIPVWPL